MNEQDIFRYFYFGEGIVGIKPGINELTAQ